MQSNDSIKTPEANEESFSPMDDFNVGLLIFIINRSVIWVILLVLLTTTLALVYLRYAPRIYESSTKLMLKQEKKTQMLGVGKLVYEQDESEIRREMQLMNSKLLLERVIAKLPLSIAYFKEGKTKFINTELYTQTPFVVTGWTKSEDMFGLPIYVKLLDRSTLYVGLTYSGVDYEYTIKSGQSIKNKFLDIQITIERDKLKDEDFSGIFYFKFMKTDDLVAELSSKLQVEPIDFGTKTISLLYKDKNPVRARDIVATVSDEFIKYDIERKKESFISILEFLDAQIDTFTTSSDQFMDSVSLLRLRDNFFDKGLNYIGDLTTKTSKYEDLFKDYEYDLKLLFKLKEYLLKTKDYSILPSYKFKFPTSNFDTEIQAINELQNQRKMILMDATTQHPQTRMIDNRIEESKIRLFKNVENSIEGLKTSYQQTREEYGKYMSEILRTPDLQSKYARLDKMGNIKNNFVLELYGQKSNYLIATAGIVSDYVTLEKASLPDSPISPKGNLIKIGGVAVGLVLGLLLIIIRYLLHNTIISVDDVVKKTRAPLLGVIPRHREEMERSQIVVTQDPKATITEAFRAIRSNLQFIASKQGTKIISTTSTIPGEGKTFVSLNIAAILSLLNKKVIILDFDMRKPRLDKIFEVESFKGVSTILSGQTTIDECIMESGVPNLDFITSGPIPPNPSELILLPSLDELIEYLKERYDFIVLDTPPIGLVTDALEILKKSDYPIYVLRASYSNRNFVENETASCATTN
ncbi:MAG: polysaccharide biosynthesis tyrosine autokinase [Bacteroidetes bacterium]|nr:polysaccharide biosynthesis tyrosine autokinase [Bacteroidota bacterium]